MTEKETKLLRLLAQPWHAGACLSRADSVCALVSLAEAGLANMEDHGSYAIGRITDAGRIAISRPTRDTQASEVTSQQGKTP